MTKSNRQSIAIIINHAGMGQGPEELGTTLITNYLNLLLKEELLPNFICFYNTGVQLLLPESLVYTALKTLEEKGVHLIACKTCVNYFKIAEKITIGKIGTMLDITDIQWQVDKVVTL